MNDLVADLLTRIRNAQSVGHASVTVVYSKMVERVLQVLKEEGFVGDFVKRETEGVKNECVVYLKYLPNGLPLITRAQRMSKSGRRLYRRADDLGRIQSGLGIALVSTSQGVMSDREARKRKIGGELLATIS